MGLRKEKKKMFLRVRQHSSCPNSKPLNSDSVALNSSLNIGVRGKSQECDKTSDPRDSHSDIELRASRRGKRLKRRKESRERKEEGKGEQGKRQMLRLGGVLKIEI